MADNQSQKRCTMDSLKEKDNPAPNPAKRPRIEVDEELMRQMIAGQAPLDSEVVRRIPEPEEEDTNALEENTSETVSGASWKKSSSSRDRLPLPKRSKRESSCSRGSFLRRVKCFSGFRTNKWGDADISRITECSFSRIVSGTEKEFICGLLKISSFQDLAA